jgi:toxin-antitoxin system PIN domain toxin
MIGVDTNMLLYSLNPRSVWNEKAAGFLEKSLKEERVVISDYVLVELYNLLRNSAVMKRPLSAAKAAEVARGFLKFPNAIRAENAPVMDTVWKLAAGKNFARRRIFDARLVLTLRHHGVTRFATANVKDFKGLDFERVWNPLVD